MTTLPSLKHIARMEYGDALSQEVRQDGEVPVFGSNGVAGAHNVANTHSPAIIVGRKGSFGKVTWTDVPGFCIDTAFYIDHRHTSCNLRWLYWALQTLQLDVHSEDTGVPGLSREKAYQSKLRTPSVADQEGIANFLDEQTARIDALIAEKERLDSLLSEYRHSLISEAVTGRLNVDAPDAKSRSGGADEGGGVSSPTDLRRLKYAVEACVNGVWGDEPNGEDDMVVVRVADFDRSRGIVSLGDSPTVRAIPESARNHRVLKPGDLLIEKSGGGEQQPVGNVVLFTDDRAAVCSNFVARMPVASDCDSRFVAYVFRALYVEGRNVPHIKQTSGIQNLDSESYLNERAWLPARAVQQRIANFLDEQTARIDALKNHVKEHIALLREYRSSLISAAVTGQLDISTFKPH